MANQTPKTAREKAAAARAEAEAADKRRRTIVNVTIGAVLLIVVAALVGGAYITSKNKQQDNQPSADAVQPTGAYPVDSAYKGGLDVAGQPADKPVLQIWEDFQCPGCKAFEDSFGPTVEQIAKSGDATVIWRMASFLDARYPGSNSQRAAAAWGCAVDAGKKSQYHDQVYANQPTTEGQGWTDQQLLDFATAAGITGDAKSTFDQCVADKTYMGWAANGTAYMQEAQIPSTPGLYLNGEKLPDSALASPEAFKKAITDAAAASPTPSQ